MNFFETEEELTKIKKAIEDFALAGPYVDALRRLVFIHRYSQVAEPEDYAIVLKILRENLEKK